MDKSKLIKFLELTASPNDGEALSAVRKANIFLRENKLNWVDFVKEKPIEYKNTTTRASPNIEKIFDNMCKGAEKAYSQELEKDINGFRNLSMYLSSIIVILLGVIAILVWG